MVTEKLSMKTLEDLKKDLGLDRRAFLKKYSKNMKGSGKLAVLVFFICKGRKQTLSSDEIKKQWNNLKSILGKGGSILLFLY